MPHGDPARRSVQVPVRPAPYQPQGYALLDLARPRADDWGQHNRLRAVARLLRAASAEELAAVLTEEFARFAGPPHRPFREALHAWAGELWTRWPMAGALPTLDELEGEEATDMTSIVEARVAAWMAEHVERPLAEGRGRERALLSHLATRRFGDEAGRAVAEAVADVEDAAALEQVGDLIVDCPTGERLLDALADGPTSLNRP